MSERAIKFEEQPIFLKLYDPAADDTHKARRNNKQKGKKSEVYPYEVEDLHKIMNYFADNNKWIHYLAIAIGCNMARRIGDILSLKWYHFFNPTTGNFRNDLYAITEDKTDKLANPHINSAVKDAIKLYCAKTGCNPADNYDAPVFLMLSGGYKGRVMSDEAHRKALKLAAQALGIEYNVGTHSARKTFGKYSRMLHPTDYDSMEILRAIYNHNDVKTTGAYIGLTKQKKDEYYEDMGDYFKDHVLAGDGVSKIDSKPVMVFNTEDLMEIIKGVYELALHNSTETNPMVHVEAITSIMAKLEEAAK